MPDKLQANPSWWQTVPGILTGIAAIITAVTGLIIAFNSFIHNRGPGDPSKSTSTSGNSGSQSALPTPAKSTVSTAGTVAAVALPVALPEIHRVKLSSGAADYTILSAEIEPVDAERRSLKFVVRFVNGGRYPSNFWSSSFRLLVDNVPRAPTNSLDEVVPADSAKNGDVIFEVPAGSKEVVFQISAGDEKSRLLFKLP